MKEMRTLTTPNGVTYEIVDDKARKAIDSINNDSKRFSAPPITKIVSGESIAVNDSAERPLVNMRVFGKTTQITTTGAQLLDFSAMTMDSGGTTVADIIDGGRVVTITGTKAYAMGYIDIDVTGLVGKTLYLSGTKTGGNSPSLTARLIKTDGTKIYVSTLPTGYTVLDDDATLSLQFIANNTADVMTTAVTATFTNVMISTVKDAVWEPYSGCVASPSPEYARELESVENPTVTIKGGNLLPITYADGTSKTMNGITFEVQSDGSVLVNGTATENAYFTFKYASNKMNLPNGWLSTYCGTGYGTGRIQIQNDIYVDGVYTHSLQTINEDSSRKQFFGKVELGSTRLKVDKGVTVASQRIYPMLCAFENPIDYESPKQSQLLSLDHTLRGIPVTYNGNYTDENGQQWICDEIDFERGVHIQRIGVTRFAGLNWAQNSSGKYFCTEARGVYNNAHAPICTHVQGGLSSEGNKPNVIFVNANNDIRLNLELSDGTVEEVTAVMNDAVLQGVLVIPVETPLTEEELAAFDSMNLNNPSTTIQNTFDAQTEVEYAVDTKSYIDEHSGKPSDELIEDAVNKYLEENPVTGGSGQNGKDGVSVTHSWNGTILTITSASGTSSVDLKGEAGKDGATGSKGADGRTPVKGVDYWTDADQEAIVQQVIAALGTPVFGTVDADNNITLTGNLADGTYTLKYEDAEGNLFDIGTVNIGDGYTNQIPISTDENNSIYNGVGYKANTRYSSSSSTDISHDGCYITGYIPVTVGAVIRIANMTMDKNIDDGNKCFAYLFDTNKANAKKIQVGTGGAYTFDGLNAVWDSNGHLKQFTVTADGFIRLQASYIGVDSIVTVNEEITD